MLVLMTFPKKLRVKVEDALQVEGLNVEEILGRDLAVLAAKDWSLWIELVKARFDGLEFVFLLD